MMARQARIDHPGLLNHVIFRGIERREIFRDADDYKEFLFRLETVKGDAQIFAWALMPNHGHFLVRTGREGLAQPMRRLLTGYAVYFNRRHRRVGHLFQNRYKSIVCDEDAYLKKLAAYIHLNPLKARLVKDLESLSRYPWSGHGAMLGLAKAPWHSVERALSYFGETRRQAIREYFGHLTSEMKDPSETLFEGGGLIRSAGGLEGVMGLRRNHDFQRADERILGDGDFVDSVLGDGVKVPTKKRAWSEMKETVLSHFGVKAEDLSGGLRRYPLTRAREALVYAGLRQVGMNGQDLAEDLNKSRAAISQAYYRAREWVKGDEPWLNMN